MGDNESQIYNQETQKSYRTYILIGLEIRVNIKLSKTRTAMDSSYLGCLTLFNMIVVPFYLVQWLQNHYEEWT